MSVRVKYVIKACASDLELAIWDGSLNSSIYRIECPCAKTFSYM